MLSIICVLTNIKFHNKSDNFYFEVILVQDLVLYDVTNVTNRYMDFILDLDEDLLFTDLYVLISIQEALCTIINQKLVNSMFAQGTVIHLKVNFLHSFGHKRDPKMCQQIFTLFVFFFFFHIIYIHSTLELLAVGPYITTNTIYNTPITDIQ